MTPKFAAMQGAQGSEFYPSTNLRANGEHGGGPCDKNVKPIPVASRGGVGHQGRDRMAHRAPMGGGRPGTGNPASRGASPVGSFSSESRVPGHGGSPQHKGGAGDAQFGKPGQAGVPGGHKGAGPAGPGNTSGLAYRRIAGRFKRASMGARPTGGGGKYGNPPVSPQT